MNANPEDFRALIAHVAAGNTLSVEQAKSAFDIMMAGEATPAQMGGLLMALRVRGETVDEITGGAKAMRARAIAIDAPEGAIDTCGTGGDAKGTFNVSTGAAIVAAACGIPVAKVGRGAPEGFSDPHEFQIAASNLTATKARLLLMACLLKFGSLPAAKDPDHPTDDELNAIRKAVSNYQEIFDTH